MGNRAELAGDEFIADKRGVIEHIALKVFGVLRVVVVAVVAHHDVGIFDGVLDNTHLREARHRVCVVGAWAVHEWGSCGVAKSRFCPSRLHEAMAAAEHGVGCVACVTPYGVLAKKLRNWCNAVSTHLLAYGVAMGEAGRYLLGAQVPQAASNIGATMPCVLSALAWTAP